MPTESRNCCERRRAAQPSPAGSLVLHTSPREPATVAAPFDVAHRYILPGLWLWQVLLLSKLGSREVEARTTEIVFAAPRPLLRQVPAALAYPALGAVFAVLAVPGRLKQLRI